jgi:endonuclease YncB( thermonuclease family)
LAEVKVPLIPLRNMIWDWPDSMVTRVIDGDSFEAQLAKDIGFHGVTTFRQKLRLNRINAVPVKTAHGLEAKKYLEELVKPNMSLVFIETVKPYKYGDEWMAEVTLLDGKNVSDDMVKNAMAVYWDGTGPRPE